MRLFPLSSREKWGLLLFPFKAYVIIVPVWALVLKAEPFYVRAELLQATNCVLEGYALCVPVFILAALIQFLKRQKFTAATSLMFGMATFIILLFLLPMCALAKG
ncbi:MAG TPA: hypothetical protein VN048_07550 [Verrucomicrobiae bacterium]|nr:hypothetical protein [Verrucomicrobiae bacterium]